MTVEKRTHRLLLREEGPEEGLLLLVLDAREQLLAESVNRRGLIEGQALVHLAAPCLIPS